MTEKKEDGQRAERGCYVARDQGTEKDGDKFALSFTESGPDCQTVREVMKA